MVSPSSWQWESLQQPPWWYRSRARTSCVSSVSTRRVFLWAVSVACCARDWGTASSVLNRQSLELKCSNWKRSFLLVSLAGDDQNGKYVLRSYPPKQERWPILSTLGRLRLSDEDGRVFPSLCFGSSRTCFGVAVQRESSRSPPVVVCHC